MSNPDITKNTITRMISLLDWVYRLGVEDAYRTEDEGLCRNFIAWASETGEYGMLPDRHMGCDEWMLRLMSKTRRTSWSGAMSRYFDLCGRYGANYLSCFFPVAQVFYCRGVKDYCSAPQACDITQFSGQTRAWWTADGLKRHVKTREYVDEIQLICFDLQRRDAAAWETGGNSAARRKGALKPSQYDMFIRACGLALYRPA